MRDVGAGHIKWVHVHVLCFSDCVSAGMQVIYE